MNIKEKIYSFLEGKSQQYYYDDGEFYDITHDFMFCSVMENEELCKEFLQRVLGVKIADIKCVGNQKSIKLRKWSKGVRLDVYVRDVKGNTYDIEMQTVKMRNLAKRSRYYHSQMDNYTLRNGEDYDKLGKNIVIFICTFDPFDEGRSVYTFNKFCRENKDIELEDEATTIFLNINGNREGLDSNLSNVLEYLKTGKSSDEYTFELRNKVLSLNRDKEWRNTNMTLGFIMKELKKEAIAEGRAAEREETRKLVVMLSKDNRNEDIFRVIQDDEYREQLLAEFNLK